MISESDLIKIKKRMRAERKSWIESGLVKIRRQGCSIVIDACGVYIGSADVKNRWQKYELVETVFRTMDAMIKFRGGYHESN